MLPARGADFRRGLEVQNRLQLQQRRPEDHHEHGREDEDHGREKHLDRGLGGLFLGGVGLLLGLLLGGVSGGSSVVLSPVCFRSEAAERTWDTVAATGEAASRDTAALRAPARAASVSVR